MNDELEIPITPEEVFKYLRKNDTGDLEGSHDGENWVNVLSWMKLLKKEGRNKACDNNRMRVEGGYTYYFEGEPASGHLRFKNGTDEIEAFDGINWVLIERSSGPESVE